MNIYKLKTTSPLEYARVYVTDLNQVTKEFITNLQKDGITFEISKSINRLWIFFHE